MKAALNLELVIIGVLLTFYDPRLTLPRAINRTVSIGVGLKQSEVEELDQIADAQGISRNALMPSIIRDYLAQH